LWVLSKCRDICIVFFYLDRRIKILALLGCSFLGAVTVVVTLKLKLSLRAVAAASTFNHAV
jgi:hypothetical protein